MTKSLRIVLIEDNPVDCARVVELLEREFADLSVRQIREAVDLDAVVAEGDFDLVLTDYLLPWTDGLTVLRAVKRRWPDVPVLMVTGSGNEEIAIEAIKSGLDDYILKSHKHLARLPTAIRTALDRLEQRHRLEEVEVQYHTLFDRVPIGLYRTTARGEFLDVNSALIEILGYRRLAERAGTVRDFEFRVRRYDGEHIWVRNTARVIRGAGGCVLGYDGSIEDVSERKLAEEVLAERTRQLEAVREAGSEITHELDLSTVLGLILRRAAELVGTADGSVYLWTTRRDTWSRAPGSAWGSGWTTSACGPAKGSRARWWRGARG
ncbi:MAG: response regulator [candidate division NC10 bacterium]|nr:response regulator [candidate division NC10 bacterium]